MDTKSVLTEEGEVDKRLYSIKEKVTKALRQKGPEYDGACVTPVPGQGEQVRKNLIDLVVPLMFSSLSDRNRDVTTHLRDYLIPSLQFYWAP